ncbi:hypothetical protein SFRURICE_006494 [Spodoptera frugiperda]|nr:hypothetical protein SFRURICE_006494 [Spodoptera frugiperda]
MKIVPENFDRVSIYPTAPEGGLCFSRVCMYVCIIVWHALQPKRLDEFWLDPEVWIPDLIAVEIP